KDFHYEKALASAWSVVGAINSCIQATEPFKLAKSQDVQDQKKLKKILLQCHEGLRIVSFLALPFIPTSAEGALKSLGVSLQDSLSSHSFEEALGWGKGPATVKVTKPAPLFPRLEWKDPE